MLKTGTAYGGEAWMMDQDGLVAGPGRSRSGGNEKAWNLYGRPAAGTSSWKNNDKSSHDLADGSDSGAYRGAVSSEGDGQEDYMDSDEMNAGRNIDQEDNDTDEFFEDDEYEMDGGSEGDDEEEANEDGNDFLPGLTPGATPQEAYIDIWNEGSDILSEDDFLELEEDYQSVVKTGDSRPQSLGRSLDPNTKYMTYLPYAGLTNQFYGMLRAIMVAKSLGRTLILPPITGSSHDKSKQNQPWSDYFDLDTFMQLTGADVVELKDLRRADRFNAVESLTCHITCGFGSLRPLDFTAKEFLSQWKFDLSMTQLEIETMDFNELVPTLRSQENDQMLCITNAYKIAVPNKEEWDLYGRYFYFNPAVDRFFAAALDKLSARNHMEQQQRLYKFEQDRDQQRKESSLEDEQQQQQHRNEFDQSVGPNDQSYEHMNNALSTSTRHYNNNNNINNNAAAPISRGVAVPPHGSYISIHARRGDFIEYCQQQFPHALSSCLPTSQELASRLNDLMVSDPSLRGLPVYISTNEDRSEELAEFRSMGWQVLEDSFLGASEQLGAFGPMMMDQVFMAQAQTLIGVRASMFSRSPSVSEVSPSFVLVPLIDPIHIHM
ncbi:hypothetical protein BGZ97_013280 [Linnemannia gamsii]|uniref:GDP-fucose protein O-fucosyltransferase 2 n=1 Tax=Linnemannia gamsii TaxID=64522 RepID=A0A9P6R0Q0_9FUNG|nr:hypothetical protein BGZ97_013280 [Linnemannia gamsii]